MLAEAEALALCYACADGRKRFLKSSLTLLPTLLLLSSARGRGGEAATLSLVFETEEDFFLPLRYFRKGEILCSQSPKGKSRLCAKGARSNCPLLTCFLMAGAMFSFLSFKMMLSAW